MKMNSLLMIVCCILFSANVYAQSISLKEKGARLQKVMRSIRQQSGYSFAFNLKSLRHAKPVTVDIQSQSLEESLRIVFRDQPFTYQLEENVIVIKAKAVDGKHQGQLKNTAKEAPHDQAKPLQRPAVQLEEVRINAGYYTVKERERTGSIARVTAREIERQPVSNLLMAMQAVVPGMEIAQSTGVPGGGFNVLIRGKNSISQGSDPLYIVNGVTYHSPGSSEGMTGITPNPSPLASINPFDIEHIEILKDADATAIYGSRGANGVLLITTKQGKAGQPGTTFSYQQGFSQVGNKLDLMNTEQYVAMRREALANDQLQVSNTDYDLNGSWDQRSYTDWQDELIGGLAPMTNIQTSVSGGSENLIFLLSGNYYREGTVYPGEHNYKRASGNLNLQYHSNNKKLNIFLDAGYSRVTSELSIQDITTFITLPPHYPALLKDAGTLNWATTMYVNPMALLRQPFEAKTASLMSNLLLKYNLSPFLRLSGSLGTNVLSRKEYTATPLSTFSPLFNLSSSSRVSSFKDNGSDNWNAEGQIDYLKQVGRGRIQALIGTTFQQSILDLKGLRAAGYDRDDGLRSAETAASLQKTSSYIQYRYAAFFGRINYSLQEKYFLNVTGRRDGSTRFGPDKRFSNFGAVGAAWLLSEEAFLKRSMPFLSFAKLRASYGITGNDQILDYGYLELWRAESTYEGLPTTTPGNPANGDYAWEIDKKAEAALELGFAADRIRLNAAYYSNRSSNQLVYKQLSPSTGFNMIQENYPAKVSNTGWEFELHTRNMRTKEITWNMSVNLTIPKNKLLEYPNLEGSVNASGLAVGMPLSIAKLYDTYVDPTSGLYVVQDQDNNGKFDLNDQNRIVFSGRKWYGGFQNSLSYKRFTLDLLVQMVRQTGIGLSYLFRTPGSFSTNIPYGNQLNQFDDRWRDVGDHARYQKFSTQPAATTSQGLAVSRGDLATIDASFVRLKNLAITYNLPDKLLEKIKMSKASIFVHGQNLMTITKYKGLDPEAQNKRLPALSVFTTGLQITL